MKILFAFAMSVILTTSTLLELGDFKPNTEKTCQC